MSAACRIERPYRVRFDESGPDGRLPASGLLRYAQDLAGLHSQGAGFGREWYGDRGLMWLIRAVELDVLDKVDYGSTLDVTTEVIGFRRVWARRRSEFRRAGEGRMVAHATIDWVMLNARGVPVRVPIEILELFGEDTDSTFTPLRVELPATPAESSAIHFRARRSELDPMDHVNNASYLDYLDERVAATGGVHAIARLPRRYRLEFILPAEPDKELVGHAWQADLAWCYRLEAGDGRELVRARLETDPATWVGG